MVVLGRGRVQAVDLMKCSPGPLNILCFGSSDWPSDMLSQCPGHPDCCELLFCFRQGPEEVPVRMNSWLDSILGNMVVSG